MVVAILRSTACSRGLLRRAVIARYMSGSVSRLAAQNFAMPAMSPTMTEGGIVEWKYKEGMFKFRSKVIFVRVSNNFQVILSVLVMFC